MKRHNHKPILFSSGGMTFMELMLVVSLIAMVSLALYKAFSNGIRVWEKSREVIIEEDIALFFDKLAYDLRNTYVFAGLPFEGTGSRVSFPSFVWLPDVKSFYGEQEHKEQIGVITYLFDPATDSIKRRQADYSQAQNRTFESEQTLVSPIEGIALRYYYLTDEGEIFSEEVLEVIPSGIEVTVRFKDPKGQRSLKRYINLPIKI